MTSDTGGADCCGYSPLPKEDLPSTAEPAARAAARAAGPPAGRIRLVAYPFLNAVDSVAFVEAISDVPGIRDIRVGGFSQFGVALEFHDSGETPLRARLRQRFTGRNCRFFESEDVLVLRF